MSAKGSFGLRRVRVQGFRSAREVAFQPGPVSALVGEASSGKSNVLAALWALLDADAPEIGAEDAWRGGDGRIAIEALLADKRSLSLETTPPGSVRARREGAPAVVFLPAVLRSGRVVAGSGTRGEPAALAVELFATVLADRERELTSAAAPALAFLQGVERCCEAGLRGLVLLVEEPELFLRPQAQRYLYRLLRTLAGGGNQVIYSTHAPAFLNVGRLEELVLVEHDSEAGTRLVQPKPLPASEEFRVVSEFDAERGELFLARSAVLVEGRTEKLVFPFVFQALGHDPDREAVSIIECGGKANIPLFGRICQATGVPFVAVHDRDAEPGKEPIAAERALNGLIAEVAGREHTIVLEPDFEAVAGVPGHKPEHAWRRFASLAPPNLPEPLARAARLALALARR